MPQIRTIIECYLYNSISFILQVTRLIVVTFAENIATVKYSFTTYGCFPVELYQRELFYYPEQNIFLHFRAIKCLLKHASSLWGAICNRMDNKIGAIEIKKILRSWTSKSHCLRLACHYCCCLQKKEWGTEFLSTFKGCVTICTNIRVLLILCLVNSLHP